MTPPSPIQCVLTIAGSDCSAGAGIQADLKTFQHFRLHGLTVLTSIVSETPSIVRRVDPVDPEMTGDQLRLLLASFPIRAAKTGMLVSADHIRRVVDVLAAHPEISIVVDPVMVASTGANLLEPDAIAAYIEELFPLATLITPNLPEAEVLLGSKIPDISSAGSAAITLSARYRCSVLIKGGHLSLPDCTDLLAQDGEIFPFTSPRLPTKASHGTGCTLSAAIAANLALGHTLRDSIAISKNYLNHTLATSYSFTTPDSTLHFLNQATRPFPPG